MKKILKIMFREPFKYLYIGIFSIVVMILLLAIQGFNYFNSYIDAFFVAGIIDAFAGIFIVLKNEGTFNMLTYSTYYVFNRGRKAEIIRYPEYREEKLEKRKECKYDWIPYVFIGVILLIIALILTIVQM